jgi:protein gp37
MGLKLWGPKGKRQVTSVAYWKQPAKWNREADIDKTRRRVFCGSLCDWAEDHPVAAERRPFLFDIIRKTPHLDWLLLSKRAERIAECLPKDWGDGWPNVWIGATIESNDYVHRADCLRAIPATVRFVSYEPALGHLDKLDLSGLDWIIYGGESGPGYRPHDLAWPREMKRRCEEAAANAKPGERWPTFFYKQMAAPRTEMGIELDGEIVRNYPRRSLPIIGPA